MKGSSSASKEWNKLRDENWQEKIKPHCTRRNCRNPIPQSEEYFIEKGNICVMCSSITTNRVKDFTEKERIKDARNSASKLPSND